MNMTFRSKLLVAVFFALCGVMGWYVAWVQHMNRPVFSEHELAVRRQTLKWRALTSAWLKGVDMISVEHSRGREKTTVVVSDTALISRLRTALNQSTYEVVPGALWVSDPDLVLMMGGRKICIFEQSGMVVRIMTESTTTEFIVSSEVVRILEEIAKRNSA